MANFLLQQDAAAAALVQHVASNGGTLLSTGVAYRNFCLQCPEALTAIRASGGLKVFVESRPEFYMEWLSPGAGHICLSGRAYMPGPCLEGTFGSHIAAVCESNGDDELDSSAPVRDLRATVLDATPGDLRSTLSATAAHASSRDLRSTIKADSGGGAGAGGGGAHKESEPRLQFKSTGTKEGQANLDGHEMTRRSAATLSVVCRSCGGNHDTNECPGSHHRCSHCSGHHPTIECPRLQVR